MEQFGNIFLHVGLVVSFYAAVMSILGSKKRLSGLVRSGRYAAWATSVLVLGATALMIGCFLKGKYNVEYVQEYSSSAMPTIYKIAALWGGQNGSLLFWVALLCAYTSIVIFQHRHRNPELLPYVVGTLMLLSTFFLVLLVFVANPFKALPFDVLDGRGLNPLLRNFYMLIHPPTLYLGFVGMSIPFAFAMAALISGRLDNYWVGQIRSWTLVAWFFLSVGNLLGALWAYEVLGWGGYWAWDPVENASFLPWLTATAFLHSVIVQEKRNMLRVWNMVLVILSFALTLMGTFLTRSGIVSSVHSFGQSVIGYYFLVFLLLLVAVSVALLVYRRSSLRGDTELDSFLSREAAALLNNLVFVGATLVVLWGTLFPLFSGWFRGTKATVGPPFYNSLMVPIGLFLLLLTGIGPFVTWRKTTRTQLKTSFLWPAVTGVFAALIVLVFVSKAFYVIASFGICAFVIGTVVREFFDGVPIRRRLGAHVVHLGVVLLFIGFTGEAFKTEAELSIKPKEVVAVGRYRIRYDGLVPAEDRQKESIIARLSVSRDGRPYGVLYPARSFFKGGAEGEPPQQVTDVAIRRSLLEDLYVAFMALDENDGSLAVKVFVNPLVQFVWLGGLLLVAGTLIVMWPSRQQKMFAGWKDSEEWKRVQADVDLELAKRLKDPKVARA